MFLFSLGNSQANWSEEENESGRGGRPKSLLDSTATHATITVEEEKITTTEEEEGSKDNAAQSYFDSNYNKGNKEHQNYTAYQKQE